MARELIPAKRYDLTHHFTFVSLQFFSHFFSLALIYLKSTNALCLFEEVLYHVALYFTLYSFLYIYYKVLSKIGLSTQKLPQLTLLHPSVIKVLSIYVTILGDKGAYSIILHAHVQYHLKFTSTTYKGKKIKQKYPKCPKDYFLFSTFSIF